MNVSKSHSIHWFVGWFSSANGEKKRRQRGRELRETRLFFRKIRSFLFVSLFLFSSIFLNNLRCRSVQVRVAGRRALQPYKEFHRLCGSNVLHQPPAMKTTQSKQRVPCGAMVPRRPGPCAKQIHSSLECINPNRMGSGGPPLGGGPRWLYVRVFFFAFFPARTGGRPGKRSLLLVLGARLHHPSCTNEKWLWAA